MGPSMALVALAFLFAGHGGWTGPARAEVAIDGLAETTPAARITRGFMFRGSATWSTSDDDYFERVLPVLPPVAELGAWHFPEADYKSRGRAAGGGLEWSDFVADSPLWFRRLDADAVVAVRLKYDYTRLDTGLAGMGGPLDLHRLEVPLPLTWNPEGSPWRIIARVSATLTTDFDASWDDALGYTALAAAVRRVSDSLSLGVGAYYDYSLGSHRFFPGAGFVYAPDEFFSASLIGPTLTANWNINPDWRLRLEGRWRSPRWVVGDTELGGADTRVELRHLRALAALERKLFEPFGSEAWLSFQAGYRFLTKLEVRDADRRERFRDHVEDGLFFGATIRVQL